MQLGSNPATTPTRIVRDAEHRALRIPWADGHESVYDWEYLRRGCRCATCHGEWNTPGYLDSNPILMVDQTFLKHLQLVGRYGGEATVLAASTQLEQAMPWKDRRPAISA